MAEPAAAPATRRRPLGALVHSPAAAFVVTAALVQAGIFLARYAVAAIVDEGTFGVFETVLGMANLLTVLVALGVHGAVSHYVALHQDEARRRQHVSSALATHAVSVAVFALAAVVVAVVLGDDRQLIGFDGPEWFAAAVIAIAQTAVLVPTADLLSRARRGPVTRSNLTRVATLAALVGVLAVWVDGRRLTVLALGWALGSAFQAAVVARPVLAHVSRVGITAETTRANLRYGLATLVHATGGWLLFASDRIVLKSRVSEDELGRYSLAYLLAFGAQQLFLIIAQLTRPWTYRILRDHRERAGSMFTVGFAAAGVVGAFGVLIGPLVFPLVAPDRYGDVRPLVALLGAAVYWSGAYLTVVNTLFFFERVALLAAITISTGATSIVPIVVLTDRLGVEAAAWATLGAYTAEFLLVGLVTRRLLPGVAIGSGVVLGAALTLAAVVQAVDAPLVVVLAAAALGLVALAVVGRRASAIAGDVAAAARG